jgi:hypothetical protein
VIGVAWVRVTGLVVENGVKRALIGTLIMRNKTNFFVFEDLLSPIFSYPHSIYRDRRTVKTPSFITPVRLSALGKRYK